VSDIAGRHGDRALSSVGGIAQNPRDGPQIAAQAHAFLRLSPNKVSHGLEVLGSRRRTALDKDIELMVLRHEVRLLKRQLHGRVRYRLADRAMLAAFSRVLPR
jgi:hypothetical protein